MEVFLDFADLVILVAGMCEVYQMRVGYATKDLEEF